MSADSLSCMPHDHHDMLGFGRTGRLEDMAEHASTTDLMKHLGKFGLHPGALACRETDDGSRAIHAHRRKPLAIAGNWEFRLALRNGDRAPRLPDQGSNLDDGDQNPTCCQLHHPAPEQVCRRHTLRCKTQHSPFGWGLAKPTAS